MTNFYEKIIGKGITFDDVLLVPAYSDVLPKDVDTSTQFTKRVRINIPISSAAMDTVTESGLAIALAYEGGIGVIHRGNSMPVKRAEEAVKTVKRERGGIISNPYTLRPDSKVGMVRDIKHSVIITDEDNKVLGIVTNRDTVGKNLEARLVDVMTPKDRLVTAYREDILRANGELNTEKVQDILTGKKIEKLVLVDKDYKLDGLITLKDIRGIIEHPNQVTDSHGRLLCAAAIGPLEYGRAELLIKEGVDVIVIDSAHGHSEDTIKTLKQLNSDYKDRNFDIVAGNIVTAEAAEDLIKAGADAVKVGIGAGSICTTRIVSGVGVPQITAIMDVANYAYGKVPVIADGGMKYSGEIAKSIAAGASSVMFGSLLAGTEESPGETVIIGGKRMKVYRGMGSEGAMMKGSAGEHGRYSGKTVAEGVEGAVPIKGSLAEWVFQLVGGLKSGMGYCGCKTIEELIQKGKFMEISGAGLAESHPHDVYITKESKNYPMRE